MKTDRLEILFNDDDLVAVVKPAGLATIHGRAEKDTVLERIGRQIGLRSSGTLDPRIRVVHRLDKETSGVLLFAKHSTAQRLVSRQFQENTIVKEYLALVIGRPSENEGRIEAALARHPTNQIRMGVVKHGGRPAITEWRIQTRYRDCTLLRVFPRTGKTHQIRVHLKHIGHPLLIDPLYNQQPTGTKTGLFLSRFKRDYKPNRGQEEWPLINRLTLHAHRLHLFHPNGTALNLEAPLPKDFRASLNMLGRHSAA